MRPRILQEPTFYFLALAACISVIYWLFNNQEGQPLQIDWQEIEARILVTELTQGFPASEEQRQEIAAALVDDYILVMEAYQLGLQNDARINDILAQKMRHVLSGNVIQPDDQELQAFYTENLSAYGLPARLTVTELVFGTRDPLPQNLLHQLAEGIDAQQLPAELDRITGTLPRVTRNDLAAIFDADFADRVFDANGKAWTGPFMSNRGQHWLQVQERFPPRTPPLDEIADQVRLDWITTEEEARLQVEIERLKERYDVSIINRP